MKKIGTSIIVGIVACVVAATVVVSSSISIVSSRVIVDEAKEKLEQKHKGINIVGTHNGYFKPEEVDGIIDEINNSGADVLFVCLGAPAQEKWINANRDRLNAKVAMGLGGSLDIFAERMERSPEIWCKLGLEWLHRLIREPWRFKRMTALPKFGFTVLFKGRKFKNEK